jgi:hypothetical protein
MEGTDFLAVARHLVGREHDEAALRSAVSRAYYAAYSHARQVLVRLGFQQFHRAARDHGKVRRYLENCGVADIARQGQALGDLHTDRIHADYHLEDQKFRSANNAALGILCAEQIISCLSHCDSGSQKQRVTDGLRHYAETVNE